MASRTYPAHCAFLFAFLPGRIGERTWPRVWWTACPLSAATVAHGRWGARPIGDRVFLPGRRGVADDCVGGDVDSDHWGGEAPTRAPPLPTRYPPRWMVAHDEEPPQRGGAAGDRPLCPYTSACRTRVDRGPSAAACPTSGEVPALTLGCGGSGATGGRGGVVAPPKIGGDREGMPPEGGGPPSHRTVRTAAPSEGMRGVGGVVSVEGVPRRGRACSAGGQVHPPHGAPPPPTRPLLVS